MKMRLIATVASLLFFPAASHAQVTVDMGAVKCNQYLVMEPEMSRNFSAWMSGWFSYQTNRPFVDVVLHQTNIANVKEWCKFHPQDSVMSGLKYTLGIK